jgi:putative transposase
LTLQHYKVYYIIMRRARVTYQGAYHHIMNRGIRGIDIFSDVELRDNFIKLLGEKSGKLKIKLLAYCLMNNHYHLILQNSSNKLSEFMKELNEHFGIIYCKKAGNKGYVFQDRYKSTFIQEGAYLQMAIAYVLLNPLRTGIVDDTYKYKWSSITDYYSSGDSIVDKKFVEDLFQSREALNEFLEDWTGKDIPVRNTRFGKLICDEGYINKAQVISSVKTYKRAKKRLQKKD